MNNDYKQLKRSRSNRMICGVCGGLGEYLNVDPTIIRVVCVLCALGGFGTGLVFYIIAAIIIPEEL